MEEAETCEVLGDEIEGRISNPNSAIDPLPSTVNPGLIRLGAYRSSIFKYSPAVSEPSESKAFLSLSRAELWNPG